MKNIALLFAMLLYGLATSAQGMVGKSDSTGANATQVAAERSGSPWVWVIVAALIIVLLVILSGRPRRRVKG